MLKVLLPFLNRLWYISRLTIDPPPAADSSEGEGSEPTKKKAEVPKVEKTRVVEIPESIRFDPKSMENKPKGLVDSLTKYFTPGEHLNEYLQSGKMRLLSQYTLSLQDDAIILILMAAYFHSVSGKRYNYNVSLNLIAEFQIWNWIEKNNGSQISKMTFTDVVTTARRLADLKTPCCKICTCRHAGIHV